MRRAVRTRGLVVAVVVATGSVLAGPAAGALSTSAPRDPADPTPRISTSPTPSDATDPDAARAAADAAEAEVAELTARLDAAEARLEDLQEQVAAAVTAQQEAEQAQADADAAVRTAQDDLESARAAREQADRTLSGHAALMYMQGGDLQNLTTMLLTPPNAMSDVSFVLDADARQVRRHLDEARAAAADAAGRQALLELARDRRTATLTAARAAREEVAREAQRASAEATRLGRQQEQLTARLETLRQQATDLEAQRERAARSADVTLLGLQAGAAAGSAPREAQDLAHTLMPEHDWDDAEFGCLVTLWQAESGWSWSASNPSSGAYGIPQALPGWKMGSAGEDWMTNPETQIRWGLGYIESTYGSPCPALDSFSSRSPHWY